MSNLVELLGETLQSQNGTVETNTLYKYRYVAFYFAAGWEPNCINFTKKLIDFYNQVRGEDEAAFEVVFVSSDDDQATFENHYAQMPWLSLSYDKEVFQNLFTSYDVEKIPTVILVNRDCDIVTRDLKNNIEYKGLGAFEYMETHFYSPKKGDT